ncbi:MAG: hypothetical protein K6G68_11045 [Oscillospiraceae bacterium]|nr:hypothetical protein [Oscillospiraceae bacterium]
MNIDNTCAEEVSSKSTKAIELLKLVFWVIFALCAPFIILFIVLLFLLWYTPTYHSFGTGRTAKMEEIFHITVTDDIKLMEYRDESVFTQIIHFLIIETDDYEKFIHDNINEPVEKKTVNNYPDDSGKAPYYTYKAGGLDCRVSVYSEENGKYEIQIYAYD